MYLILLFKSKSLNCKIIMTKKTLKIILEVAKYVITALLGYLGGVSL